MSGCDVFRTRLERELAGRVGATDMRALAWHEHLLGCGACRELLEAEQALEELLASLPTPQLSPAVARRVLARLRELRTGERTGEELRLDALLELDVAAPPSDLARGVLAGLSAERAGRARGSVREPLRGAALDPERALDRLLEFDVAEVPAGLAARVLAGLAAQRRAPAAPTAVAPVARATPARFGARRLASLALPIAAGVLVALGGWALWPDEAPPEPSTQVASLDPMREPEPELLAALDVLEEWDLLMDMEQDLDLLFATLEPADELLLDFQDGGGGEPARPAPEPAPSTLPPALPPKPDPGPDAGPGTNRDSKG